MKVLVSAASKHGATSDIAAALGETLAEAGFQVDVVPPPAVTSLAGVDAVVLGSSVYVGQWLDAATDFLERFESELAARPVWLFSSGPVGDPPRQREDDPPEVAAAMATIGAREHRVFAGLVDGTRLGLGEKVMLRAVRAGEGDYRPWDEIRAWAREIATSLKPA